ncbi:MAG: DNA (cytosine-5-)-methyltransferase [Verrucomicrobiota bacterium]|nr:DNA (cytosine-5-)-methyltransferase [Verrucomicrobiota bacterium]
MKDYYSISEVADMLSVSKETLRRWDKNEKLTPVRHPVNNYRAYPSESLKIFEQLGFLFAKEEREAPEEPHRSFNVVELFAGAGGLALGMEKAGLKCKLLNEIDHWPCETLRKNRPQWNVIEQDVSQLDFTPYQGEVDVVTGGFPCQSFSYAGHKLGMEDARGTLFYEFARAVQEIQPLIAVGENVRGLVSHEEGRTLAGMVSILDEIGYDVLTPQVLKAIHYQVPQKRERLFLVALKKGSGLCFDYPRPFKEIYSVKDALKAGPLYPTDVPDSPGQGYPKRKKEIMDMVPPGGYWRDLPIDIQKEYMMKSFYLGGGKTGMARRISWDEPCLTLTCSPAQKQTDRCHPEETRPFTIREYARIQTFPDDWEFAGPRSAQYKQIGNAVPVNLAYHMGVELVRSLNEHHRTELCKHPERFAPLSYAVA